MPHRLLVSIRTGLHSGIAAVAVVALFALVFTGAREAGAVGWLPVGPSGGAAVFAVDPAREARVYAGIGHVLYRSNDSGAHWSIVHRFDPGLRAKKSERRVYRLGARGALTESSSQGAFREPLGGRGRDVRHRVIAASSPR